MKTEGRNQVFDLIKKSGNIGPTEMANQLSISVQMVHRHLKSLLASGQIIKKGAPPKVYYFVAEIEPQYQFPSLSADEQVYINQNYLIIKPDGRVIEGLDGFQWWAFKTKQHKQFKKLAHEYIVNHQHLNQQYRNQLGLINATFKIEDTFEHCYLDHLFYKEFYSMPKFGKTKTGQMIYLGKTGQDRHTIQLLAQMCKSAILKIIKQCRITGITFAPHSIPRKIAFLKEFKRFLGLTMPSITLTKIFADKIPIAQKSLSKLIDRIENANSTIFLPETALPFKRVLVIDDAVGSGATLNVIAEKLKKQGGATFVCGFAVTGSLKDFEVIREI